MPERVKLLFQLKDPERMKPGSRLAFGSIDIDLGAVTVPARVLWEKVSEDGCSVELELEVPDGSFPPKNELSSFYSVEEN